MLSVCSRYKRSNGELSGGCLICREMALKLWLRSFRASLVAQMGKGLLAMQETWVRPLGWEDLLEKEIQPTLVFLLGEFRGRRSLAGHSPQGRREASTGSQRGAHGWATKQQQRSLSWKQSSGLGA